MRLAVVAIVCASCSAEFGSFDDGAGADAGTETDCDALAAGGWTLAPALGVALHTVRIPVAPDALGPGPVVGEPLDDGTTLVAWAASGGSVHVSTLDGAGARRGRDLVVAGDEVHGLAASPDARAVLVYRSPDVVSFVKVGLGGTVLFDNRQLGGGDQSVTGTEWWQTIWFMGEGRLAWTGSEYVAYMQVRRLWPDGIAHVGDTLRFFGADGSRNIAAGWDWGCSHSMDQRLALSGATIGPVCLSDCYPDKGVFFNHGTTVSLEPGGDCAGQIAASLGGLAPVENGFWLSFGSSADRTSHDMALVHIDASGLVGTKSWLTDTPDHEEAGHLVGFAGGLLAGWRVGAVYSLARLDAGGVISHGPEPVAAVFSDHDDFLRFPNGDAGWLRADLDALVLTRVRACN